MTAVYCKFLHYPCQLVTAISHYSSTMQYLTHVPQYLCLASALRPTYLQPFGPIFWTMPLSSWVRTKIRHVHQLVWCSLHSFTHHHRFSLSLFLLFSALHFCLSLFHSFLFLSDLRLSEANTSRRSRTSTINHRSHFSVFSDSLR